MKSDGLTAQIQWAFFWYSFLPLAVVTLVSLTLFTVSLKTEAINKISADVKTALLIYRGFEEEMGELAQSYARQPFLPFVLASASPPDLSRQMNIADELASLARVNQLSSVMIIDRNRRVVARSKAIQQEKPFLPDRTYIEEAFSGINRGFTELLTRKELISEMATEYETYEEKLVPPDRRALCMTGIAPIYDSEKAQILGAVILRKFIRNNLELIENISETIDDHAEIFNGEQLILKGEPKGSIMKPVSPLKSHYYSVYFQKQTLFSTHFSQGGFVSSYSPIYDVNGNAVAMLMIQANVLTLVQTHVAIATCLSLLFILLLFLPYLLMRFLNRMVVTPILLLNTSLEQIGNGKYSFFIDFESENEIGKLIRSFNQMTQRLESAHISLNREIEERKRTEDQIQQSRDELERRVIARTADLSEANSLLKTEIDERLKTEHQLKSALSEKETLLKEVHHRVKNNLQIISSLLEMTRSRSADLGISDTLAGACARIHTMSLIHNQLYLSSRYDCVTMQNYIEILATHLSRVYGKNKQIVTHIHAKQVILPLIQAMPCALVFNELISNSYKHAFMPGQTGNITISITVSQDQIVTVYYQDDGIGIPEDINIQKVKSLGMKLIYNLTVKQLKGTLQISRTFGTVISFDFKSELKQNNLSTEK